MKILFAPISPFVTHPERIAVVAAIFFAAAALACWRTKKLVWPVIVADVGWTLFAFWERYCNIQGYNIRVDLFLITPVLYALTLWGATEAVIPGITTRSIEMQFGLRTLMILITVAALALGVIVWLIR